MKRFEQEVTEATEFGSRDISLLPLFPHVRTPATPWDTFKIRKLSHLKPRGANRLRRETDGTGHNRGISAEPVPGPRTGSDRACRRGQQPPLHIGLWDDFWDRGTTL